MDVECTFSTERSVGWAMPPRRMPFPVVWAVIWREVYHGVGMPTCRAVVAMLAMATASPPPLRRLLHCLPFPPTRARALEKGRLGDREVRADLRRTVVEHVVRIIGSIGLSWPVLYIQAPSQINHTIAFVVAQLNNHVGLFAK